MYRYLQFLLLFPAFQSPSFQLLPDIRYHIISYILFTLGLFLNYLSVIKTLMDKMINGMQSFYSWFSLTDCIRLGAFRLQRLVSLISIIFNYWLLRIHFFFLVELKVTCISLLLTSLFTFHNQRTLSYMKMFPNPGFSSIFKTLNL